MECAKCGESTVGRPCRRCGADPLLDGRYRLLTPLGRGTSGTTWRARSERTGELVAIKEMVLGRADDGKTRELWRREVRVLEQLDHPQIPRFVESFEVGRGRGRRLCLVQELVRGRTLDDEMQRRRYTEDEVVEIARGLLPVLEYLHGLQPPVVHRDVKPENVLRREGGGLVLLDFGSVRDSLPDARLGGSTVAGTFGYMAPEQFRGEGGPAVDAYALGGLMVTLLTRKAPHTLLDPAGGLAWRPHCRVSPATAGVIDALLDREPSRRPLDRSSFDGLLERGHLEVDPIESLFAPRDGPHLPGRLLPRALMGAAPAVGATLLGLLAIGLGGLTLLAEGDPASPGTVEPEEVTARLVLPPPPEPWTPPDLEPLVPPRLPMDPPPARAYLWNQGSSGRAVHLQVAGVDERVWVPANTLVDLPPVEDALLEGRRIPLAADVLLGCGAEACVPQEWAELELPPLEAPAAWPHGLEGEQQSCSVEVVAGTDGRVVHASASGCPAPFARAAERTVRQQLLGPGPGRGRVTVPFDADGPTREVVLAGGATESVYVDGQLVGTSPWLGRLALGVHEVRFGPDGGSVEVRPGVGSQIVRP